MANVSFFTRSIANNTEDFAIHVLVRDTSIKIRLSTGVNIPASLWNEKTKSIRNYYTKPENVVKRMDIAKKQLSEIKERIELFLAKQPKILSSDVKDIIVAVMNNESSNSSTPQRMKDYIPYLITAMKNGNKRTKYGNTYEKGTISSWSTFLKNWVEFQDAVYGRNLAFEDVTLNMYYKLVDFFFVEKEFTADTCRKHIITLKAIMQSALNDNLHSNVDYLKDHFTKSFKTAKGKRPYLNNNEIDAIYNLNITDEMLDMVRDLFLVGCWCGQRVSDYSRIDQSNLIALEDGTKAISIYQVKTDEKVIVPYLDERIETVLKKWNYNLPKIAGDADSTATLINRHIKTICCMAGIKDPFTIETMRAGKVVQEYREKWEVITTHCARRTAITNLFKRGDVQTYQIMKVSGHKTEKTLYTYLCLSNEEIAMQIAKILKGDKKNKNFRA